MKERFRQIFPLGPCRCIAGMTWVLLAVALAAALPTTAAAQASATLTGRVADAAGAPIVAVVVEVVGPDRARFTARTDEQGNFRMAALPAGRYRLRAARVGYQPTERSVVLASGETRRVDLLLAASDLAVDELVVEARAPGQRRERERFETDAGVTARVISGRDLKMLPGLAEADVLRAVELLPGVVSTSDFSSAFNVRGGSADQNLILLDYVPIFNPFHLGGLFSVFNPDVVGQAELLAGGFGAQYGGRVSSVLTVESTTGRGTGLHGEAGVSLLSSRLALHSNLEPDARNWLGGEGGGWVLSGRRSYFDQLLRPVLDFPYYLVDLQGFAQAGLPGGGRVQATAYTGRDVLDLSEFTPPRDATDSTSILRIRWSWGNDVAGIRWEQPLGAWTADVRLGYSRFGNELGLVDFSDARFASGIDQLSLGGGAYRDLGARTSIRAGAEVVRLGYENRFEAGGTEFGGSRGDGVQGSAYVSAVWRPERWIVEPGLRFDGWYADEDTRTTVSPRLAVKRFFGTERNAAAKIAVGRYTQFLHSLRDEQLPFSIDTWVVTNRYVPPVVSDQVQAGWEQFWGEEWSASAEAYYRRFNGVTEFNPAEDPNDAGDDLLIGRGRSYGLDLLLRRLAGALTGWATVSLLQADRTFADPLGFDPTAADSLPLVTFSPVWDRRLDVDVVAQYRLPYGIEAGTRWNFGSGLPYTRPIAQYTDWDFDISTGTYRVEPHGRGADEHLPLYVALGQRNRQRYPAYHRLDATVRRPFRPAWGTVTPYLQVLNLYNRKNVLFYFFNYDRTPPTRSGISMFPVLPTVGVEVSF